MAKIRGWFSPHDDSAFYPLIQDLVNERISMDTACSKIFQSIDEKIAARKLDDVNFLDLWYSAIHTAKRIDFLAMQQRDQMASLVEFVGKFKAHLVPENEHYSYLYESLTDFGMACREAFNDMPVPQEGSLDIEATVWASMNHFLARITDQGHYDLSMYAIWAIRLALETEFRDDEYATAAQKYEAYLPAVSAWIIGAGNILFTKKVDLTPTDPKEGDPAGGGELWTGRSEFSKERWAFWKERLVVISGMDNVSEHIKNQAKTAVEEMERAETFELVA